MKKKDRQDDVLSTRDFMRDFSRITHTPKHSAYTIVRHGRPIGTYIPSRSIGRKKYMTLKDLEKVRFRSGEKDLSKKIDRIVYGIE